MLDLSLPSPSSTLPALTSDVELPVLSDALTFIRGKYNPPVCGSGSRTPQSPSSTSSSIPRQKEKPDPYERKYTVDWLTRLCRQLSEPPSRAPPGTPSHLDVAPSPSLHISSSLYQGDGESDEVEKVLDSAASLLAVLAGSASAGMTTRAYLFPPLVSSVTDQSGFEISITDIPLSNADFESVGGQTWGSAYILAEVLLDRFQTPISVRILELGAGTGLLSIALAHHFDRMASCPELTVHIDATDFHPAVLDNLARNIRDNPMSCGECVSIGSHALDWATVRRSEGNNSREPMYDIIVAADVVYDPTPASTISQAEMIHNVVSGYLRPQVGKFHLLLPLRKGHDFALCSIEQAFANDAFDRWSIDSKDTLICEDEDDVEKVYVYFVIGWR